MGIAVAKPYVANSTFCKQKHTTMKNRILVSILCILIRFSCSNNNFQIFKAKYNKTYFDETENVYRQRIFQRNVELINKHNSEAETGKHTYKLGVNQFADLTKEEWVYQLGLNFQNSKSEPKFSDKK